MLKSELARELKNLLEKLCPVEIPDSNLKSVVIDFMAFARKIPTKKMMLATYEDFFKALWRTFSSLSKGCSRINIVFNVYLRHSIKQGERNRRVNLIQLKQISHPSSNYLLKWTDFGRPQKIKSNSNNYLSSGHVAIVFQKFLSI